MKALYEIKSLSSGNDSYNCSVSFDPMHSIFVGHFPGNPIVPGVCLMEMMQELSEKAMQVKLKLLACDTVKFLQLVIPGLQKEYVVSITVKQVAEILTVQAAIKNENVVCMKFTGRYTILTHQL